MNPEYLSQLLRRGDMGGALVLTGLAVAFGLGAVHALSPGHGKTIVAAYLVGSRGTVRHALLLGAVVTFTHTVSVFALGLGTLFLSQYVLPDRIAPVLGVISGISIVWIGAVLLLKRLRVLSGHGHTHSHGHDHAHPHEHVHPHEHGEVSTGSLIALGASGGLVPCPSALVLLLSAVAVSRVALGLVLLVAFSAGLAAVLMAIGVVALYARQLLGNGDKAAHSPFFRYVPVFSAAVILGVGLLMTGVAAGIVRPGLFVG